MKNLTAEHVRSVLEHPGRFDPEQEAFVAYRVAAKKHHGDFRRVA